METYRGNIKEIVMMVTTPMVFVWNKAGSQYIQFVHSAAKFMGDPFNPAEYQTEFIGFVCNRIMGGNPYAILLEDAFWNWTRAKVVKDIVKLTTFFDVTTNRGLICIPKPDDTPEDMEEPMLLMIPMGLVEWMLATPRTP